MSLESSNVCPAEQALINLTAGAMDPEQPMPRSSVPPPAMAETEARPDGRTPRDPQTEADPQETARSGVGVSQSWAVQMLSVQQQQVGLMKDIHNSIKQLVTDNKLHLMETRQLRHSMLLDKAAQKRSVATQNARITSLQADMQGAQRSLHSILMHLSEVMFIQAQASLAEHLSNKTSISGDVDDLQPPACVPLPPPTPALPVLAPPPHDPPAPVSAVIAPTVRVSRQSPAAFHRNLSMRIAARQAARRHAPVSAPVPFKKSRH